MKISVTKEHIEKGRPGSCCACPVALAMIDAGLDRPGVTKTYAHWESRGSYAFSYLPIEASVFVDRFDYRLDVQPFDFEITDMVS